MELQIKLYKMLIWLTLYASALHFFDNVYFFDQYPEPAWLTAPIVGALWIPLALLAHRAIDRIYMGKIEYSFVLIHSFVLANWISLGHYLFASPAVVLPRINFAIFLQVIFATLLLIYTLYLQYTRFTKSLPFSRRTWLVNIGLFIITIIVLELIWPSTWDNWWFFWP
ncbi:hypothetical protein AYL20_15800 [Acinetobacter venetianus]|uniref:hypothetical protein n=1 Tax=Acinetobacter venetianus TaxID=52133 RepID=UPI000775B9A7|nr:hypothetical protein [Acinetobacter venetianus]KXO81278.1 hypothetical protein AYL20_15800 [Acinetobacter venetianus]